MGGVTLSLYCICSYSSSNYGDSSVICSLYTGRGFSLARPVIAFSLNGESLLPLLIPVDLFSGILFNSSILVLGIVNRHLMKLQAQARDEFP